MIRLEDWLLSRINVGIISLTAFLVLVLGIGIITSVLNVPPRDVVSKIEMAPNRQPSSVPILDDQNLTYVGEEKSTVIDSIYVGCLRNGATLKISSKARLLRLKGRLCNGYKAAVDLSLMTNESNGFSATLFSLTRGIISTDYISLADGSNRIVYEFEDVAGEKYTGEVLISYLATK